MRTTTSSVAALIAVCALGATAGETGPKVVYQPGDYVLVLGRLAECTSWPDRPIDLVRVTDQDSMSLLRLPPVLVRGQPPEAVASALRRVYEKSVSEAENLPLRVELVRGYAHYREALSLYLWSRRHLLERSCPSNLTTPPIDGEDQFQAPPSIVRDLLGELG